MPYSIINQKYETCCFCEQEIPEGTFCWTNYDNDQIWCDDCETNIQNDHNIEYPPINDEE